MELRKDIYGYIKEKCNHKKECGKDKCCEINNEKCCVENCPIVNKIEIIINECNGQYKIRWI